MYIKTLNGVLDSTTLTVESEIDFSTGMLPTLDFQTCMRQDWEVEVKYYAKPMASGLVIQIGTALSKQTIFSSLRQELIRPLLNTSEHYGPLDHVQVIEQFTQSLANSGHRYSFTKSIILQALTGFKTMKIRSKLDVTNLRFEPLYRDRWCDFDKRCMLKKTLGQTWYSNKILGINSQSIHLATYAGYVRMTLLNALHGG